MMRLRKTKPGFAMMLVLILVATGAVLGFSYLSVASLQAKVSENFRSLSRARYLAESGLEHALYTVRLYPEQIENAALGPFYADGSSDYYYISAEEIPGETGLYLVTATATVGEVRRTSSVTVRRTPGTSIELEHGLLVEAGMVWLPWDLVVNADIHVNGSLTNEAAVNGDASATAGVSDLWWRITGQVEGDARPVEVPQFRVNDYVNYSVGVHHCTATEFTGMEFRHDNPLAKGGAVTPDNVAGVVHLKPSVGNTVYLDKDVDFTGTLIIEGNLVLKGGNVTLTATEGMPALVVTGAIIVRDTARNVSINGVVFAGQGIVPSIDKPPIADTSTTINGALICGSGAYDSNLDGTHVVNFDGNRTQLYDMTASPEQRLPTATVTEWHD